MRNGRVEADKGTLLASGIALMQRFCEANQIVAPRIRITREPTRFATCAYYRDGAIYIWPPACAALGTFGRQWSWPGHSIDRTPYGVIQHELGHYVDKAHGKVPGAAWAMRWWDLTDEKPLTGYAPDPNEWFAEMFRLFVTNPTLLAELRPKTYRLMSERWLTAEERPWREVLSGAARQIAVLEKRIVKPSPLQALPI